MGDALNRLRNELRLLKLDDSLLYLNYLLGVSRQEINDPQMQRQLAEARQLVPPFVVHFLAKQIIQHSTPVGPNILDWARFRYLVDLFFELDDPVVTIRTGRTLIQQDFSCACYLRSYHLNSKGASGNTALPLGSSVMPACPLARPNTISAPTLSGS